MIVFRKTAVQQPQGASFLNFNRYTQLSGPMADDLKSVFVLANATEENNRDRLVVYVGRDWGDWDAYNYDWVTLHGKGTKLTVWSHNEEKSITAKSEDDRLNTFKLSLNGIRLADVDGPRVEGFTVPRIKITAPQLNWATGAKKVLPSVDPLPNPTDSVTIPPNAKVSRLLTGRWDSNLGQADLVQTGDKVVGTLRSKDQLQINIIDGQLTGTRLDFTAFPIAGDFGHGHVLFKPDGNSGEGPYISTSGTTQTWKLNR